MMLEEILSIPSCYGHEDLMIDYVVKFGIQNRMRVLVDGKRNVYLTKGATAEGESYPCVVAHTDTVHVDQIGLVATNERILIKESTVSGKRTLKGVNPKLMAPTGIGGDNKCGVYIALKLMLEFDVIKGAFFVEEEIGMMGSKESDDSFFSDVGYAVQFDAPTRNWFSSKLMNVPLWNKGFFDLLEPVLQKHGVDNITNRDPFTDVLQIRKKYGLCCAVFPTGYYNQHSRDEYVVPEETEECVLLGIDALTALGMKRYLFG
jgi:di/tripeptidase